MTIACEQWDTDLEIYESAPAISDCATGGVVAGSAGVEVTVAAATAAYQPEKTLQIRVAFTATWSTSASPHSVRQPPPSV